MFDPIWFDGFERGRFADKAKEENDVLVIGGGVAGASVAFHAARMGLSTCLLEAGHIASRASGRNDGQVLLGLGEHINRLIEQWGEERALELWGFLDANHELVLDVIHDANIDCGLQQSGGLRLAENETERAELEESAAILRRAGVPSHYLDEDAVRDALPPGRGFLGGLLLEREAIFDPFRFVHGLVECARDAGAAVREYETVTRIEGGLGDFRVETDTGAWYESRVLVHATAALGGAIERSGFLSRAVFPFRGQILATNELPEELAASMPPWAMSSNFCYEYFRMHGRTLTLGGMRWAVPGEESGITDDTKIHEGVSQRLRSWLELHFPEIAKCGVAREWTGIMAGTKDGLPLVGGIPGRAGEYGCVAFNGYGMSFAFLAGLSVAEMIRDGRASRTAASLFRPDRFS